MNNSELKRHLSEQLDMDLSIIIEAFDTVGEDEFNAAAMLVEVHGVDKAKLGKIWGDSLGFAYVDPNSSIVNPELIKQVGVDFILQNNTLPLYKFGRAVTVSTCNPTNPFIQDKLEKKLDSLVSLVFCFPFDIKNYLKNNIQK